ncbi:MAG: DUF6364 family protein [Chloroflexi bacterium]|nr:DUF6364 family protein [Chloroflexota bacterium]
MLKTKLTVRVEKDLLEKVKHYATKNNTTLTDLIDSYFKHIPDQSPFEDAPIVRRISGTMSVNSSGQDYKKHLEEKYAK